MSNESSERDETHRESPKLPYARPALTVYGDLGQLTLAKGMTGVTTDGALAVNNKTS